MRRTLRRRRAWRSSTVSNSVSLIASSSPRVTSFSNRDSVDCEANAPPHRIATEQQLVHGIVGQPRGVVGVVAAERQAVDALAKQIRQTVTDPAALALIPRARPRAGQAGGRLVPAIQHQPVRLRPRPPRPMCPPYLDRGDRLFEELLLARTGRVQVCSQGSTLAIDQKHPLRTLALLGLADSGAPFFAGAELPSPKHSSQRTFSASFDSASKARHSASSVPSSSHCRSRRQHVVGLPYWPGNTFHGAPVHRIHRMPPKHLRSSAGGRPPRGPRLRRSSCGAIRVHCASLSRPVNAMAHLRVSSTHLALRGLDTSSRQSRASSTMLRDMTIRRMDHVGIVVDDLSAAVAFFVELGLELEVEMPVEGRWVDRVVGLDGVRVDIAMMRTPDGHGGLELTKFHRPTAVSAEPKNAPANTLGIRRIMFAVEDIEVVLARLRARGAELVGEVAQYEDSYRLCYVRGPEGIIVALAE